MTSPPFNQELQALQRRKQIEEEEFLGRTLKRKRRRLEETERKLGSSSYLAFTDINWFAPSFLVEVSRGVAGLRIPFVGLTSISKCDVPRSPNGKTHPRYSDQAKAAEGHFGYIERQERATRNKSEGHLVYIERDEARDSDSETGRFAHVLTNIHRNPDIRRDFARRVWAAERPPHAPRLLAWSTDAEWWAELARHPDAPTWVRSAAECVAKSVKRAEAKLKPGKELKPFQVDLGTTTLGEAYERLVWADERMQPGDLPKLDFSSRYGGRVQHRLVFELPFGLTARERFEVARGIARWCKQQRFMYVIAIHQPDSHNDSRNYHVHVDFYDRPCRWLKRFGLWDFEVTRKARNGDIRYPYRQRKRLSLSELREGAWWKEREKLLKRIRLAVVEVTNAVLEQSGLSMLYHPGPASELGLAITAMKKLGGRKMAAERAGLETAEGDYNADALWGDRKRAIEAAHAAAAKRDEEMLRDLREKLFGTGRAQNRSGMSLAAQIEMLAVTSETLRRHKLQLEMVHFEFDKARSRAEVVLREARKAEEREAVERSFKTSEFRARRSAIVADAQRHLSFVASIAPKQQDLDDVTRDIAELERDVQALRQTISRGTADLALERKETEIRLPLATIDPELATNRLVGFDELAVEQRVRSYVTANPNSVRLDGNEVVVSGSQANLTLLAKHHGSRNVCDILLPAVEKSQALSNFAGMEPAAEPSAAPIPKEAVVESAVTVAPTNDPEKAPQSSSAHEVVPPEPQVLATPEATAAATEKSTDDSPQSMTTETPDEHRRPRGLMEQAKELAAARLDSQAAVPRPTAVGPSDTRDDLDPGRIAEAAKQEPRPMGSSQEAVPSHDNAAAGSLPSQPQACPEKSAAEADKAVRTGRPSSLMEQAKKLANTVTKQSGTSPSLPSRGPDDHTPDPRLINRGRDAGR